MVTKAERQQEMTERREKGRNKESDSKEEISSTEFPEGGGAVITKEPRHPHRAENVERFSGKKTGEWSTKAERQQEMTERGEKRQKQRE